MPKESDFVTAVTAVIGSLFVLEPQSQTHKKSGGEGKRIEYAHWVGNGKLCSAGDGGHNVAGPFVDVMHPQHVRVEKTIEFTNFQDFGEVSPVFVVGVFVGTVGRVSAEARDG